ncbi:hypothetical protein OG563_26735 [Nocardia vinacea]|uniref:Uncharacterized protein n=1 Tax=Nocardia vinacea TaxID=96468 RepID=A0ABZ1YIH9_9NOCA|nr:hypothetical protein [Nocardia vinacea]
MSDMSPMPGERDVHLVINLDGITLNYTACLTAALVFIQDWRNRTYPSVTVHDKPLSAYPRLPNERLFLEP